MDTALRLAFCSHGPLPAWGRGKQSWPPVHGRVPEAGRWGYCSKGQRPSKGPRLQRPGAGPLLLKPAMREVLEGHEADSQEVGELVSECGVGGAAEQASALPTALPGEKIQDTAKWGPGVSPHGLCQGKRCILTMSQVVVISPDRPREAIAVLDCMALWDRAVVPNPSPCP